MQPGKWDGDKVEIVRKVIKASKSDEDKVKSPIKATAEILKLAVRKVIGYDSNKTTRKELYTSSGQSLKEPIQREFALKTSQASRDKWKMSIVALEDRFNSDDSDNEEYADNDKKSVIKRKVVRTQIDSKIHGHEYGRNMSPIRSGSPYSDLNFDINFEALNSAVKKENKKGV